MTNETNTAAPGMGDQGSWMGQALHDFTEYFVKNYPGPDTIICDPTWHAPKLFRNALWHIEQAQKRSALAAQPAPVVGDRIVLLSRGVEPNWWFIAERSKRPDVNGLPIYETLDPITRATRPAESVAQGGEE